MTNHLNYTVYEAYDGTLYLGYGEAEPQIYLRDGVVLRTDLYFWGYRRTQEQPNSLNGGTWEYQGDEEQVSSDTK